MASVLDSVLAQYENSKQGSSSSTQKMSQDERMKKYFAPILSDKEKDGQRRLRILPTSDGSSPFKEVWYHEIKIDGKSTKIYDPGKNENERSPLNEVFEELMSTGKESDKKLASEYRSRKFYIVKVIDRDHEEDGPKFWRFKHNYKQDGIFDKIFPILKSKGDITDPETGRDLILELNKAKSNSGSYYTVIQTIMHEDPSKLSDDAELAKSWLEDETTWNDVYAKKPVEYLEALANGETPRWDSEKGGYVYSNSEESVSSIGGTTTTTEDEVEVEGEDLPF